VLKSGYVASGIRAKDEVDWDLKFLIDWMAASLAGWGTLTFYVENQNQERNLKILAKELKFHTIQDILNIIDSYYEFKYKEKGKIRLL